MNRITNRTRGFGIRNVIFLILFLIVAGLVAGNLIRQYISDRQDQESREAARQVIINARQDADDVPLPNGWTRRNRTVHVAMPLGNTEEEIYYWQNSIGMQFVLITPGEFRMGMRGNRHNAGPAHTVRISKPFLMSAYEVTIGQYESITGKMILRYYGAPQGRDAASKLYPAGGIKWSEAVEFCNELSRLEGMDFRLPTEAEWEYACRAGTTTRFYLGNRDPKDLICIYYKTKKDRLDQMVRTSAEPVGRFPANPFGLFDISGNVWEWCQDWYDPDYYSKSPVDDPQGPASGRDHVIRGGAWDCGRVSSKSTVRTGTSDATLPVGFRVVLPLEAWPESSY